MLGTCLCVSDSIGSKRAVSSFTATAIFPFILIGANQNLIDNIQDSSEKFSVLKLVPIHFSTFNLAHYLDHTQAEVICTSNSNNYFFSVHVQKRFSGSVNQLKHYVA